MAEKPAPLTRALRPFRDALSAKAQNPGAFSIWSNQSKPISLTMRLEITINRASDVAWALLKCWWMVKGGT